MFSETKVTEIYYMADYFCKEFVLQQEKYMIEDKKTKHLNKPNCMSDAEIMVITPLRVCRNQRILIHKTFEGVAERGKCSMGCFFGFKLHLIINDKGKY